MKLCVLGNSHAGCLNLGWQRIRGEFPHIDIRFFASRASTLSALRVNGNLLVPKNEQLRSSLLVTSGGLDVVDVSAYDAFFLFGLGHSLRRIHAKSSLALRLAVYSDFFRSTLSFQLAGKIRKLSSAPIFIGHSPQHARRPGDLDSPDSLSYDETLTEFLAAHSATGFIFSSQPRSTLVSGWFTDQKFSTGSVRLDVGDDISSLPHPEADFAHMNADFGEIYLRHLLRDFVLPDSPVKSL